jgi:hypothetical protein
VLPDIVNNSGDLRRSMNHPQGGIGELQSMEDDKVGIKQGYGSAMSTSNDKRRA